MLQNIAIIGLWRQWWLYLDSALNLHNKKLVNLIAVCEKDIDRLEKLNISWIKKYSDFELMLWELWNQIDLVIVCLPNNIHKELIDRCLGYSFLILKEKPLASNKQELEFYKENNLNLSIAQQRYFMNSFNLAKEWMHHWKIWEVIFFDYLYCLNDTKESWYWEKNKWWWAWINIWWHMLFTLLWFFEEISEISIEKLKTDKREWCYDTEDTVVSNFIVRKHIRWRWLLSVVDSTKQKHINIVWTKWTITIKKWEAVLLDNLWNILEAERDWGDLELYEKQILFFVEKDGDKLANLNEINKKTMNELIKYISF